MIPRGPQRWWRWASQICLLWLWHLEAAPPVLTPPPPTVAREFRGAWIATLGNIDWPSRSGLSSDQQRQELRALLDTAVKCRLNAVILQVRPTGDALYESAIEPWSEYLSGRMGVAPSPKWDPLADAVAEAHARGLELHAWFNPFRVRHEKNVSPIAPGHISRTRPELVRSMGPVLWLDPGEPEAVEHTLKVILDVTRRYDVDGIHLDDYFYPYPGKWTPGLRPGFPDDSSYQRYRQRGGRLDLADWRRDNVNRFVSVLNERIHREKPWVRFGISPFGIWRPNYPAGIRGMDAYDILSADARKWLREGSVDYLAPQLYWPIRPPEQSFPALLHWWAGENVANRGLWPGMDLTRIGSDRNANEILSQIQLARRENDVTGMVFWNISALHSNRGGVANLVIAQPFATVALPPPMPWLNLAAPGQPLLSPLWGMGNKELKIEWTAGTNSVTRWIAQARWGSQWKTELLSPSVAEYNFSPKLFRSPPDEFRLRAVGRAGLVGREAEWRRKP